MNKDTLIMISVLMLSLVGLVYAVRNYEQSLASERYLAQCAKALPKEECRGIDLESYDAPPTAIGFSPKVENPKE